MIDTAFLCIASLISLPLEITFQPTVLLFKTSVNDTFCSVCVVKTKLLGLKEHSLPPSCELAVGLVSGRQYQCIHVHWLTVGYHGSTLSDQHANLG